MYGVTEVFDYWAQEMGHPRAKLDPKRRRRIEARLREGATVEELRKAILGAKLDPFLMGRDPRAGRKFDGIETIFRDRAQVERLVELYENPRAVARDFRGDAVVAWGQVLEAIRRVGAHRPPPHFKDPLLAKLVARWGWRNLCLGDETGDRMRFLAVYQELARQEHDHD